MSQRPKTTRQPRRLKVWQRLFIAVVILILLGLSSTLFSDFARTRDPADQTSAEGAADRDTTPAPEELGWEGEPIYAYVIASEGELTVPFYNEGLAEDGRCGRGTYVRLESWEPFVAENGTEYYHVFVNGDYGYIRCESISDDKSDVLQETQVYVRTAVNLFNEPDGLSLGHLTNKGDLLRIVGYDYLRPSGEVNMYEVKLGTEIGWIRSDYVTLSYAEALENWNNEDNVYNLHVLRGDSYGGGNAADLDYWPHTKADFSADGNVMPESVYALYISIGTSTPEQVQRYLDLAEGTAINTIVFTVYDDSELAFPSKTAENLGLLEQYHVQNTTEEFMKSVQMVKDAGYYTVARITAFSDYILSKSFPEWSITDLSGQPVTINGTYWPSVFCRSVWEYKVALAIETVDTFGFNEIQYDYIRFPDYIQDYEEAGTVDLKNEFGESKAQAIQRFLIYAKDAIHDHGAYVSADVFGETSNDYVAPYGQYWPAISTVVDVISGMPYPDHYNSYYTNKGMYRYYEHPYATLYDWGIHVRLRQSECSSPAIVRTWIQTWDDYSYEYDSSAIQREILGLYDAGITGGYMPWHGLGNLEVQDDLVGAIDPDYYALYQEAKAQDDNMFLSTYMGIDTTE